MKLAFLSFNRENTSCKAIENVDRLFKNYTHIKEQN